MARLKPLENTYKLPNRNKLLDREELDLILHDFEYYMANYTQIVDKGRQTVPFKLNKFQRRLAEKLIPFIAPATRLNRRHNVVVVKPRQVGGSVFIVALINYLCAFMEGINHLNVMHTFPVEATITKFYAAKVEPIITGVHPSIFPTMYRQTIGSSILTQYHDIKGIERDNMYELISANASSIRSATSHVLLMDEVGFYSHPEDLEAAILPTLPDYGFSLVVYLSTFEDKKTDFFLNKIQTAIDTPDDYTLLFVPWFLMYPEVHYGVDIKTLVLTDYDKDVILPELMKAGIPEEDWGDAIDWYHRKSAGFAAMKKEYPTTLQEVLEAASDEKVVPQPDLDYLKQFREEGMYCRILTDPLTNRAEAQCCEMSPLKIFRKPRSGHTYILTVDPVATVGDNTDYFAASMFDRNTHEQVASMIGRGYSTEDWAAYCVGLCKIYNRAQICPENNIAGEFVEVVKGQRYYNWYYPNQAMRKKNLPGLRTSVDTKEKMVTNLLLMLRNHRLTIHDPVFLDQLETFERKVKRRPDGTVSVRLEARKGKHDDAVACLWLYAGMMDSYDLTGQEGDGWAIL